MLSARNLIIAGAFTVAASLPSIAPVLLSPAELAAQDSGCATGGEEGDLYTGACVPYLVPNTGGLAEPATPTPFQPSPELEELEDVNTPGY